MLIEENVDYTPELIVASLVVVASAVWYTFFGRKDLANIWKEKIDSANPAHLVCRGCHTFSKAEGEWLEQRLDRFEWESIDINVADQALVGPFDFETNQTIPTEVWDHFKIKAAEENLDVSSAFRKQKFIDNTAVLLTSDSAPNNRS